MHSELFALGAALCIALGGMLAGELAGRVDALTLTRWQSTTAALLTATAATAVGGWSGLAWWHVGLLASSGASGIIIASTAYISAIFAIGPRLALLIFSLTSPFALVMGYLFLGETVGALQLAGVALVFAGIVVAILFGRRASLVSESELPPAASPAPLTPSLWTGIGFGLVAALGQAAGSLIARPAMADGVDPFAAMAVRAGVSAFFFMALTLLPVAAFRRRAKPTRGNFTLGLASAAIGTGLGMSLLMAALASGKVGIVSTLSSLTPVLVLPMVWLRSGVAPGPAAWLGAAIAVAGTALITLG